MTRKAINMATGGIMSLPPYLRANDESDKEIKKSASGKEEIKVVNDAKDKAEKLLKDVDGILTKMKKK